MSTTRLKLYNSALTICGETLLHTTTGLTEEREPRRLLDQVWDNDGVDACLERGQWHFAMRTSKVDYDAAQVQDYGLRRSFTKPSDWILTSALCSDEYFRSPLVQYADEADFWYADIDEIYVKYVSNDASYGGDLSLWPATFSDYVSAAFAAKIVMKLTADEKKWEQVMKWEKKQLLLAKSNAAMAGPQKFPAPGNFVNSRNRFNRRNDRGNRNQLLG